MVQNGKRHGRGQLQSFDMPSSGPWFDGWREGIEVNGLEKVSVSVGCAQIRIGSVGWRCHGLIPVDDIPGPKPRTQSKRPRRRGPNSSTPANAAGPAV